MRCQDLLPPRPGTVRRRGIMYDGSAPDAKDTVHVRRAAVVGAGTMGAAIAELLAFNGIDVLLKDLDQARVDRGLEHARRVVDELVTFHGQRASSEIDRLRGLGVELNESQTRALQAKLPPKVTAERGSEILSHVHGVTSYEGFSEVDFAVEAVFESTDVKRLVLAELDAHLSPTAVIGSNTSSLSITALAHGLGHPDRVLVTHFFNPPGTLPLVEVSAGLETRDGVVEEVMEFLQGLRNHRYPMVPIRVRESPGFVVNRILLPVLNEACFALGEGIASARDIDLAMKTCAGLPMGPFELADLIGLDVTLEVAETLHRDTGDPKYRPSSELRRRVAAGQLGRKSGRGFYEYV